MSRASNVESEDATPFFRFPIKGIVVFIAVYIFMFATRKKGSNLS